jgi:uncharacterized protein YceK
VKTLVLALMVVLSGCAMIPKEQARFVGSMNAASASMDQARYDSMQQ